MWFSTGSGRIELQLTKEQARIGYHSGACDADVKHLSTLPKIRRQLAKLNPEHLRADLKEYGAWTPEELADHAANLQRILWLACGDIFDTINGGKKWRQH